VTAQLLVPWKPKYLFLQQGLAADELAQKLEENENRRQNQRRYEREVGREDWEGGGG